MTSRTYRIGFENDPPFHFPDANGKATGLIVDIVSEAARRINIQLQWIYEPRSSEAALRSGSVDMWPIMTMRPERKAYVHITEPYRESEACLVIRAERPYQRLSDLNGLSVCHNGQPLAQRVLEEVLPKTKFLILADPTRIIEAVCRGEVEAAYMDEFSAISALMDGAVCGGQKLRVIHVPETRGLLGIGATFEAAAAADALRGEISNMAEEGKLAALVARWSYFTGRSMELNEALIHTQRRQRYLIAATAGAMALMLFMAWLALRIRHQRNRAIQAEEARRTTEERYAALFNNMMEGVALHRIIYNPAGKPANYQILEVNSRCEEILGMKREAVVNHLATEAYGTSVPPYLAEFTCPDATGIPIYFETYFPPMEKHFSISVAPMGKGYFATIFADITAKKHAEEEKAKLEEHLQQVQRMESIGRLAGGVAHDFNNLLTVINGYAELLLTGDRLTAIQQNQLSQVKKAGNQAASLTQQLLAFGRRQIIQPRMLNLNTVVQDTQDMLRRLVGEDIEIITVLDPNLASIMADPGQMNQVLMNLVVNARDAMPKGGKLLIETANIVLDASYAATHPEVTPGRCILLTVSDTGVGIDKDDLPHIFEPFFTTKGKGEGTGLGLSMVYGIVRQSQGWIWPYSEVGKGTTFKIYLPQIQLSEGAGEATAAGAELISGVETILLVEDQENVRTLAAAILRKCGYRMLEAVHGEEALSVAQNHLDGIDLLLTDVVLPGMTGKELADRLKALRPEMKVLFSSGYTEDVIVHRGVLNPGISYLAKPYTPQGLAAKVREVLDQHGFRN
jgi:signal transduction histidine kinase/CheY-like chemotaxis protein/ABC-type amino acid transport substrate-binding protein